MAGTYTDTLRSGYGCDSLTTLVLTVNETLVSTARISICNNQLPYTWNGQQIAAAGTYTDTLKSKSGCDSVSILELTVNAVVTSTTNITVCGNELPYNWNGQSYNSAGTYTDTLQNIAGCDSIARLVLTVNLIVTGTANTIICTNQLPYNWNGKEYTAAGTYTDTLTSTAGCDSVATLNLTVRPVLLDTTAVIICASQLPYTWHERVYTSAGTFSDTLTSAAGCDSVSTLVLMVNPALTSIINTTICNNQLPYNWKGKLLTAA